MSLSLVAPKITWGAAFVNTLEMGWGVDEITAWSQPAPSTEFTETAAGDAFDAWGATFWQMLGGVIRWIPASNLSAPLVTGWNGSTGWRAFLESAWQGNIFRWFPDRALGTFYPCLIVAPRSEMTKPGLDSGLYRQLSFTFRTSDGSIIDGY